MSSTGLIVVILVAAASAFWIALPMITRRKIATSLVQIQKQKAHDELLTTYERILASIRDLDEDFNTGKLQEDVYQQERAYWADRGVQVLQQLDPQAKQQVIEKTNGNGKAKAEKPQTDADAVLDDAIEDAILAYRQAKTKVRDLN